MFPLLFVLCAGLAWFDFKTLRIPNGATLPILIMGLWLGFPGTAETWLATAVLLLGWRRGWLGGGDVKLWLALIWIASPAVASPAFLAAAVWLGTGAAQLAWRYCRGGRILGVRRAGAWRALPFTAWLVLVS